MEEAFGVVPRPKIFAQTGLQFMQLNTLFQLLAAKRDTPELLAQADCLLFMPDFIHWALCGSRSAEFTIASTSQCPQPAHARLGHRLAEKSSACPRACCRKS